MLRWWSVDLKPSWSRRWRKRTSKHQAATAPPSRRLRGAAIGTDRRTQPSVSAGSTGYPPCLAANANDTQTLALSIALSTRCVFMNIRGGPRSATRQHSHSADHRRQSSDQSLIDPLIRVSEPETCCEIRRRGGRKPIERCGGSCGAGRRVTVSGGRESHAGGLGFQILRPSAGNSSRNRSK